MFLVKPIAANSSDIIHTYLFLPPELRRKTDPVVTVCSEKIVPFFMWTTEQTRDFIISEKASTANYTGKRMCPACCQKTEYYFNNLAKH